MQTAAFYAERTVKRRTRGKLRDVHPELEFRRTAIVPRRVLASLNAITLAAISTLSLQRWDDWRATPAYLNGAAIRKSTLRRTSRSWAAHSEPPV
jgi:hypothetical protein